MDLGPVPPAAGRPRRRGLAWRVMRYGLGAPFAAFGAEHVFGNARVIPELTARIRTGPGADGRMRVDVDRRLDVEAMALAAGVSIAEIERLLTNRRRQTARAVFFYFAGGFGFMGLWLFEAVQIPAYARLSYVVGLLGICAACFLSAFYNALVNWQIRTLRLETAREFLRAEESWWPS